MLPPGSFFNRMAERIKVLIVGDGAREHAIGWKIKKDSADVKLFFAPGNGGTGLIGDNKEIEATDIDKLLAFAKDQGIDFTIVGPEKPLEMGVVDAFREARKEIFGHTKKAAVLETSKAAAIRFMRGHHIPHPESKIFSDREAVEAFVMNCPWKEIVVKASGLAAGKGVILPDTSEKAIAAIRRIMVDREFDDAGEEIVIQKREYGKEVSVIGFISNEIGLLVPAQDYKRALDGDEGKNTGGMGAYAPNVHLNDKVMQEIWASVLLPTQKGAIKDGFPLTGIIYAGLMLTIDGPKVLEYNMRFGDPETQVQLRLLESNLLKSMKKTINGTLTKDDYRSSNKACVGVVLASEGYPGKPVTGRTVKGLDTNYGDDIVIFHAGTKKEGDEFVSSGGRVSTVTATGETREEARQKIYPKLENGLISLGGGHWRKDIAE